MSSLLSSQSFLSKLTKDIALFIIFCTISVQSHALVELFGVDWETEPDYAWDFDSDWGDQHSTWTRPNSGVNGGRCLSAIHATGDSEDSRGFVLSGLSSRGGHQIRIRIFMACPNNTEKVYWMETSYQTFSSAPADYGLSFDSGTWNEVKWFDGPNGNDDTWQEYSVTIDWDGSDDILAVGFKSGSALLTGGAPELRWDDFIIEDLSVEGDTPTPTATGTGGTPTFTSTPTSTELIPTPTESLPTETPTGLTNTATPKATSTFTISPTNTSVLPTQTLTPTSPTSTPTMTQPTPTPTATLTPTYHGIRPTATSTSEGATHTPTATEPTSTPTATEPSPTSTITPTGPTPTGPTPTATNTPTDTATPTNTPTSSATPTPEITFTPTETSECPPDGIQISAIGEFAAKPDVSLDRFGHAHVVWVGAVKDLWYAKIRDPYDSGAPDIFLIPPTVIYPTDVGVPHVAADTEGNAHVVFTDNVIETLLRYAFVTSDATGEIEYHTYGFQMFPNWPYVPGAASYSKYLWPNIAVDPLTNLPVVVAECHLYAGSGNPLEPSRPWYRYSITAMTLSNEGVPDLDSRWDGYLLEANYNISFDGIRYPDITVDANGTQHCVWADRENSWNGWGVGYSNDYIREQWVEISDKRDVQFTYAGAPKIDTVTDEFHRSYVDIDWATRNGGEVVWQRLDEYGMPWDHNLYEPGTNFIANPGLPDSYSESPNIGSGAEMAVCAWTDSNRGNYLFARPVDPHAEQFIVQIVTCANTYNVALDVMRLRKDDESVRWADFVWKQSNAVYFKRIFFNDPTPTPTMTETPVTPTATPTPGPGTLKVTVVQYNKHGMPAGPLPGAVVEVSGAGTQTTDDKGEAVFSGLDSGAYRIEVSATDFHSLSRDTYIAPSASIHEIFQMIPTVLGDRPVILDAKSLDGYHFIPKMTGTIRFVADIFFNDVGVSGPDQAVKFKTPFGDFENDSLVQSPGNLYYTAKVEVPAPDAISGNSELSVWVKNKKGYTTEVKKPVYFHADPDFVKTNFPMVEWYRTGKNLQYKDTTEFTFFKLKLKDFWDISAVLSVSHGITYNTDKGAYNGAVGGAGQLGIAAKIPATELKAFGSAKVTIENGVKYVFIQLEDFDIDPFWTITVEGKQGIEFPIYYLGVFFPPAAPVISTINTTPILGDVAKMLKIKLAIYQSGTLKGVYKNPDVPGENFFGCDDIYVKTTYGIEIWGGIAPSFIEASLGVYAKLQMSPEIKLEPHEWPAFKSFTITGIVGVSAQWYVFTQKWEIKILELKIGSKSFPVMVISPDEIKWEPMQPDFLKLGPGHQLARNSKSKSIQFTGLQGSGDSTEEVVVENVSPLAKPSLVVSSTSAMDILFTKFDESKPWYGATDIVHASKTEGNSWSMGQVTDDDRGDFSPQAIASSTQEIIMAWSRIGSDISGATGPEDFIPQLEIFVSNYDRASHTWSEMQQLTDNEVVDRFPQAIHYGDTSAVLWIQNESSQPVGDATSGDSLMIATWNGSLWSSPQVLWSDKKGIGDVAYCSNEAGEGFIVFVVDEDGDALTAKDKELYQISTQGGIWGTATRLTQDDREDNVPELMTPNDIALLVWSSSGELRYSRLGFFIPKPLLPEEYSQTAPDVLTGVTLPGGAAIAYSVGSASGMDIAASFYDATLNLWSLPRQLTNDDAIETALDMAVDGNDLVISYLKTSTIYSSTDVIIDGTTIHIDDLPEAGQRDICLLRHPLGYDLAVNPDSVEFSSPNPAPDERVTVSVELENRGDQVVANAVVSFYDGDPGSGGKFIRSKTIAGYWIGGATKFVSIPWKISGDWKSHHLYIVVDPEQVYDDRDRSNNIAWVPVVLPDIQVDGITETDLGGTTRLFNAQIVNRGVIPSDGFDVAIHIDAPTGELLETQHVSGILHGATHDLSFQWDTGSYPCSHAVIYVLADSSNEILEADDNNNAGFIGVWTGLQDTPTPTPTPPVVSPTPTPNFNLHPDPENHHVDAYDLIEFIKCMRTQNLEGDFNRDGVVDHKDLYLISIRYETSLK